MIDKKAENMSFTLFMVESLMHLLWLMVKLLLGPRNNLE